MNDYPFERKLDAKLILSILATGIMTFGGILEETAMNIAFPTLMEEFSITLAFAQWLTSGYLLPLIIMMPASAYLKKVFRMKTLFITTCVAFLGGTLLCFAAPAFIWVIIGRVIQGAAAGVAVPLTFNIVLEQSPPEHLGFLVGFATMANAMAPAFGPVYGGLVLQYFNWRMIFGFLIPVLAAVLILGAVSIRQSSYLDKRAVFDSKGFVFYAAALSCLVFGLNLPNSYGWNAPVVICLLIGIPIFLFLFIGREKRTSAPLLNLKIFKYPVFTFGIASVYCCCTVCPTLSFMLPNYLQMSRGMNPLNAAMVLSSGCIVGAIATMLAGHLYDRKGPRPGIILGGICAVAGIIVMRIALPDLRAAVIAVLFMIYMVGHGCCVNNNMTYGLRSLGPALESDGNAAFNITSNLAGTIGIVIASGIVSSFQVGSADIGEGTLAGVKVVLTLLVAVVVALNIFGFQVLRQKSVK